LLEGTHLFEEERSVSKVMYTFHLTGLV